MKLPAPKAIIFDWDNTLVNTWPIIHEAMNNTFRDLKKPLWTFEQTKARVRKSMRDAFPEVFGEGWESAATLYQNYYRAIHLEQLEALPQAEEVLEQVKARGWFCVVVSNKKGVNLRKEVEHIGWGKYFDNVIGADDAPRDKPHTDPVHLAFEKSHIKPGPDVWFVGDSDIDLHCALNTGCTAILYGESARDHAEYTKTHFQGFPYHAHVHSHNELLELISAA